MFIDASSTNMEFTREPGCGAAFSRGRNVVKNLAVFNLQTGYVADPAGVNQNAFKIKARVTVQFEPGDVPADWRFSFVQICEVVQQSLKYAGPRRTDGSILVVAHRKPALAQPIHLDGDGANRPFTTDRNHRAQFDPNTNVISNSMGDHPISYFDIGEKNRETGKVNWLVEAQDFRRFWTVFTAQDPQGKRTYLGHIPWEVLYSGEVSHPLSGAYQPRAVHARLNNGTFKQGRPTEAKLQTLLDNPSGDLANDIYARMWQTALSGNNTTNRQDHKRRNDNLPPNAFPGH